MQFEVFLWAMAMRAYKMALQASATVYIERIPWRTKCTSSSAAPVRSRSSRASTRAPCVTKIKGKHCFFNSAVENEYFLHYLFGYWLTFESSILDAACTRFRTAKFSCGLTQKHSQTTGSIWGRHLQVQIKRYVKIFFDWSTTEFWLTLIYALIIGCWQF